VQIKAKIMTAYLTTLKLSCEEIKYLHGADFIDPFLLDELRKAEVLVDASVVLRVSREAAESLRDTFTLQLAKVGFNENYDLTPEGRILEDLIDRFHFK
jgi:nicotinic acid phosphoribosyltransferase